MLHSPEVAGSCPYVAYVSRKKIRYKFEAVSISYNLIQIVEITSFQNYIYRKINAYLLLTHARTHTHTHKYTDFVIYSTVGLYVISL
jgi:hypothetical protein